MYRISQLKIPVDKMMQEKELCIKKELDRKYNIDASDIRIKKESIDARNKENVCFVYTVDFDSVKHPKGKNIRKLTEKEKEYEVLPCKATCDNPPVIAGFGPAGMFCALILAEAGLKPIVIERGKAVEERMKDVEKFWNEGILDTESNVQFGEGGAGTFSDGKLTTGIKDFRIGKVLDEFVEAGAPEEIKYQAKPHIGTDVLRIVVKNMREKILSLGGEIRFSSKLTGLEIEGMSLSGIEVNDKDVIRTDHVVLALGHSARDTFAMLKENNIPMEQKAFSVGVRVEHLQSMINESQYGRFAEYLPPADYKVVHHLENGRGVYSFCMCPGGEVITASNEENMVVTNGMSYAARDSEYANSALLVDVKPSDFDLDDVLAGVEFQRKYERLAYEKSNGYFPVKTFWGEFKRDENNRLAECLPKFVREAYIEAMPHFGKMIKGFDSDDMIMKGVETRSSSPVRILRNALGQSEISGIFPCGEGAGYAGGITSAAVDGIRTAEKIIADICEKQAKEV